MKMNWPILSACHALFLEIIRRPSVPSDGFQPPSQQALSVDRGFEPSVPHAIQPLKSHSLHVLLYHLLC